MNKNDERRSKLGKRNLTINKKNKNSLEKDNLYVARKGMT